MLLVWILGDGGAELMKKYRVNESEHFNLYSMHDKLKCIEIDM